jgi:hypothetical protein
VKTEIMDLELRSAAIPCSSPDCNEPHRHKHPADPILAPATAYELCPSCGLLVVARCWECGGQEACTQVLRQHGAEYHGRGCQS